MQALRYTEFFLLILRNHFPGDAGKPGRQFFLAQFCGKPNDQTGDGGSLLFLHLSPATRHIKTWLHMDEQGRPGKCLPKTW